MSNHSQPNTRLIKLSDAVELVVAVTGGGCRPNPSTLYRWATRGVSGVRLQIMWAGDGMRTSQQWVEEFFSRVTEKKCGRELPQVKNVVLKNRRRQIIRRTKRENGGTRE